MVGGDPAVTQGNGSGVAGIDSEACDGGANADDVDDGVVAADLVELDLIGGHAVQRALDVGEPPERGGRPLARRLVECGAADDREDVVQAAGDHGAGGSDVDRLCLEGSARHRLDADVGLNR